MNLLQDRRTGCLTLQGREAAQIYCGGMCNVADRFRSAFFLHRCNLGMLPYQRLQVFHFQ